LLLKQKLLPADFMFSGITLRSGGRLGLPGVTAAADRARQHVSDVIMNKRGAADYRDLQLKALASITATGPDRQGDSRGAALGHHGAAGPIPMGGGGLQWTPIKECDFLVAMSVDENGIASLADGFSGFLGESAGYEVRQRIARYLDQA
jgi:hypothetical protein